MKKVPACAWCGDPLGKTDYIQLRWEAQPGRPSVAWHDRCWPLDPLYMERVRYREGGGNVWQSREALEAVLTEIAGRGEGRVLWLKVRRGKLSA